MPSRSWKFPDLIFCYRLPQICSTSSTVYSSQVLEATQVPISKWVDQKTALHLHNGILHSRKKGGAPTLHNSMDGTEKQCTKWKKTGGKRQIPYDLTYKWNLINKTNKWAKYNQKHWNKEQTDTNQRGEGRAIMRERRGRVVKEYV